MLRDAVRSDGVHLGEGVEFSRGPGSDNGVTGRRISCPPWNVLGEVLLSGIGVMGLTTDGAVFDVDGDAAAGAGVVAGALMSDVLGNTGATGAGYVAAGAIDVPQGEQPEPMYVEHPPAPQELPHGPHELPHGAHELMQGAHDVAHGAHPKLYGSE
jgi:hypothetical protein